MNNVFKNVLLWVAIGVILMLVFQNLNTSTKAPAQAMNFSTFVSSIKQGQVADVTIDGNHYTGSLSSGQKFSVYAPKDDSSLVKELLAAGVKIDVKPPEGQSLLLSILISWFPMLLLIGVWIFFMRQMGGGGAGGRGAMSFGRSRARMLTEENNKITFADVAGVEEAKEELAEIVDFLRDPQKFQRLGGRIPKGVLLMGSPGSGKTLLARAIAGEARVPFFSISGSDFVEMFVGVGASRVRDMFEQAKKHAPCIIFIDEIDAVGRQRGAGLGGGNDEREQTLNQLLVEMDGFEGTEGIIVIAATNRPDVLDPALLRPGRFDRQVTVPLPDIRGREQILQVHMRKVPIGPDVDPKVIARGTPGFSGADLANLVNEAALMAARKSKRLVDMHDFEDAKDKVMMGAERKSVVMSDKQRETTAYHESGHAVVAKLLPGTDPVHKVTIIPRGRALGLTMQLPTEDRFNYERQEILNNISILMGGRIAEEVFLNQMTTGAGNDIERATDLARKMVTQWGMSQIGPMVIGEKEEEVFLGREVTKHSNVSEQTAQTVDAEVRNIIQERYQVARNLIEENRDKVEMMAKALLRFETLDANQVNDIMAGRDPRPPADSSGSSPAVSNQPNSVGSAGANGVPNLNPGGHPV
ncbi:MULTISPECIES: ATP-dependent zinc metalloprotease FtsH [Acidithiobacillus]|jgi:cell division protease FtsH|uniref:ATP-dependent zinc metalloprotease FtsH n=1 Tax=Acidithiobacillus caldus (strain ATCC 51756 / DSM 8584 / KU) TaxID=637389 RepID=A0A060A278_ACICK|nr:MULTISPECIES: ATP-dependent zinc metalloprotease FtsH [Acidithiobacillus]AIA56222.1 Cell division protein FtsH [Acidithiobacillus caldus ATCC 51756]MBU2730774.1 ATP-dependent metallopeptidase FtsH/Yme1/Tma family protein [Acidithiobacillus caldus]MBU2735258.1 ATP-dependent metallopeptidase FtsH/Yme1/Tma family protein [Acidithiobacillus caldus ATCC 51756]MBU2745155.1 ATP-dependent metallopeptidase FtsH/Yme1/Tma family protein [Acidithiobacillus caldus]MBU2762631.1 ATP-dependent metallopepti